MSSWNAEQKAGIISAIIDGGLTSDEIAANFDVTRAIVSAFKASLSRSSVQESVTNDANAEALGTTFGLERDLQLSLRTNIEQLEAGLKIIDGGRECTNEAGRIDILAENQLGEKVVIELKAGNATNECIAQILSYMGVEGQGQQKPVRGIIIAGDFPKRVVLAASAVPNLELRKYKFRFGFETV